MIEYYEADAEDVTKSPDVADKLAKSLKKIKRTMLNQIERDGYLTKTEKEM